MAEGVRRGPFAGSLILAARTYPGNPGSAGCPCWPDHVRYRKPRVAADLPQPGWPGDGREAGDDGRTSTTAAGEGRAEGGGPGRCAGDPARPDGAVARVVADRGETHADRVPGGQSPGPGRGADLLQHPVDLPRPAGAGLSARPARRVGDEVADRRPQQDRARLGADDHQQRADPPPEQPLRGRDPGRGRPGRRPVVGVRLRGRLHAGLERDLRRARGRRPGKRSRSGSA